MAERTKSRRILRILGVTLAALLLMVGEMPAQAQDGSSPRRSRRGSGPAREGISEIQAADAEHEAVATEGRIPVLEMLKFLQVSTGKLVLYPSTTNDPMFQPDMRVTLLHQVDHFNAAVAQSILEANGYEFYENRAPDGRPIIHVSHGQARQRVTAPQVTPILTGTTEMATAGDEERVTLHLQLQHADTQLVITALRELLGITGRAGGSISIVNISSTHTLIMRGKLRILRHAERIVRAIDRPVAKPVMRVIDVHNAKAGNIAQVLERLLKQGQRTDTFVVADEQASKLVIESRNPERLKLLEEVIQRLDVPSTGSAEAPAPESPPKSPPESPATESTRPAPPPPANQG